MEASLKKQEESNRKVYFHMTYHPQSPQAHQIQQIFEKTVLHPTNGLPFNELGPDGQDIPLDAMVVANH